MPDALHDVAAANDLRDGEMKEVVVGDTKILLACVKGSVHAVGAECPHYGASLAEGILCGDRVVCPWHKSVFRVTTGELLDPPSLDGLAHYRTTVRNGRLLVDLTPVENTEEQPSTQPRDNRCIVIVGAGAAGTAAAERLRELKFGGRIVMLSSETEVPYDRTKLSKEYLSGNAGVDALPLRPPNWWQQLRIERLTRRATDLEVAARVLNLDNGSSISYDALLIASGSTPRPIQVSGADLGNVFTLRSQADAAAVWAASQPGARTAIIGGSFIALEVASCFAIRKLPVTVVIPEATPFAKLLGSEVGSILQRWHEEHGVQFEVRAKVTRLNGTGVVRSLTLEDGRELPADVVVVGTGVAPATQWAKNLPQREDGGILADKFLRADNNVYVAGDSAVFPETYSGAVTRIEHWRVAQQHGRAAAENMLGHNRPFEGVPYFWTNHFGTRFDYVGHASDWDEVILRTGEPPAFLAFYIKDGAVQAAAGCRHDNEISALQELMRLSKVPALDHIRGGVHLASLLYPPIE